jgi:3-oxoacyl-[acyl-carrier-protein] synthase III
MDFTRVGYLGGVQFPVTMAELIETGTLRPGDLVCSFAEESSKWMCAGAALRWSA